MKKSKLITIILIVFIVGVIVCGSVVVGVYNAFLKPQSFICYVATLPSASFPIKA